MRCRLGQPVQRVFSFCEVVGLPLLQRPILLPSPQLPFPPIYYYCCNFQHHALLSSVAHSYAPACRHEPVLHSWFVLGQDPEAQPLDRCEGRLCVTVMRRNRAQGWHGLAVFRLAPAGKSSPGHRSKFAVPKPACPSTGALAAVYVLAA